MIFEAIQHLLIPAPKEVKALGYLREAIAIEARYARCHTAWADHLKKCQQHILAAAERLEPGSTIMIVGSGALHDVPVADLRAHSLILVDIVHLPKIRKRFQNTPDVRLIEQDVTGLVRPLFYRKESKAEAVDSLPKADLVISLNILSQLPLNLIKYAGKHHIPLPDDFAGQVMVAHLGMLKTLAPHALIIGDVARCYYQGGELVDKETAVPDLNLPTPQDHWDWHIAPKGELDRDISLTHNVACWQINPVS